MAHTITPSPSFVVRLRVTRTHQRKSCRTGWGPPTWVFPRCQIDFWTYFDHPVSAPRWLLLVHAKKIFHVNSRYWDTQHQFNTCWFSSFRSVEFGFYRVDLLIDDLLYFRMQNLVCGHKSLWLQRGDYSVSSRPMRMCGELVAGVLGTKAGRPRPFPTTTQLGMGL